MQVRSFLVLAFLSLLGTACSAAQRFEENNPAQQADMRWLQLVDAGDYAGAWKRAARLMQSAAPEPVFQKSVSDVRTPLGAPGARTLMQVQTKTALPGVPDGHYVIAQYATAFTNKAHAVETIIAAQEPDGSWHVAGYFIR